MNDKIETSERAMATKRKFSYTLSDNCTTFLMVLLSLLLLFINPSAAMAQSTHPEVLIAQGSAATNHTTRLSITNRCEFPVWMVTIPNANIPPLSDSTVQLSKGQSHDYSIPNNGWAGRFWPKVGCDSNGMNCAAGEAIPPCPPSGCQPPADTKVEINFANLNSTEPTWYNISLVDGYSLPIEIKPRGEVSGSCITTKCNLSLAECPQNEIQGLGDLRVIKDGKAVQCLSPCKKWNYPAPFGLGKPETEAPGVNLCCPNNDVEGCRKGIVTQTNFVQTVHRTCPTAYSYAYDDQAGLHSCPTQKSFDVTLCP